VQNGTVYTRTRWYYRRVDIAASHKESIPGLVWNPLEQQLLSVTDAYEFEVFYSSTHTDDNEASSIYGPAKITNHQQFTERLSSLRTQSTTNQPLNHLQVPVDYLFCRYKYTPSKGSFTHHIPSSTGSKRKRDDSRTSTSSNSSVSSSSSSVSTSSSEHDSMKKALKRHKSSFGDNALSSSSSSLSPPSSLVMPLPVSAFPYYSSGTSSSSSSYSTHPHTNAPTSPTIHILNNPGGGGNGNGLVQPIGAVAVDQQIIDLPRITRVGGKYQLSSLKLPTPETAARGTNSSSGNNNNSTSSSNSSSSSNNNNKQGRRAAPTPMWLRDGTNNNASTTTSNADMQEFLQYIGAKHQPDKFREFAMGILMQVGGDVKTALFTMKAMSALPKAPPETLVKMNASEQSIQQQEYEADGHMAPSASASAASSTAAWASSSSSSSSSASSSSSSLSQHTLSRRTSTRERIKSNPSKPKPEGHALPLDYMTPKWAAAVITGLGRLLVPYTVREIRRTTLGRSTRSGVEVADTSSDYCGVCRRGGKLLLCDTCDSSFHLKCVGLKSTPRGNWMCLPCQQRVAMDDYQYHKPVPVASSSSSRVERM